MDKTKTALEMRIIESKMRHEKNGGLQAYTPDTAKRHIDDAVWEMEKMKTENSLIASGFVKTKCPECDDNGNYGVTLCPYCKGDSYLWHYDLPNVKNNRSK